MSRDKIKNALITGAAKRVGREIAIALAKDGWNIIVHHNSSSAEEVVSACKAQGVKVTSIKADLNVFSEYQTLIEKANNELGEISLLINNASIFEQCKFSDTNQDVFDRHMNINFKAPFFLTQQFAKQIKSEGHVINICDTFVTKKKTTYFAYLLSKKVFRESSKMLAAELSPKIRVNAIFPGALKEFSENVDQEFLAKRKVELPMQDFASVEDVISTIQGLQSSNLTGQEIFLDGGEQLL